jgi:hypothetical protein
VYLHLQENYTQVICDENAHGTASEEHVAKDGRRNFFIGTVQKDEANTTDHEQHTRRKTLNNELAVDSVLQKSNRFYTG